MERKRISLSKTCLDSIKKEGLFSKYTMFVRKPTIHKKITIHNTDGICIISMFQYVITISPA